MIARRSFLRGLVGLIAAPAVVKYASLMPVRKPPLVVSGGLLSIDVITREAIRLFKNSNSFIQNVSDYYNNQFAIDGYKTGSTLRIRLPNDYRIN